MNHISPIDTSRFGYKIAKINNLEDLKFETLLKLKQEAVSFDVKDEKRELGYLGKVNGVVRPILNWEIEK